MSFEDATAPGPIDRSAVFEVLPTAYVVLTPELVVADANEAYLAVTGRQRADLLGRYFLEAFPPPADSLGPDGRSELQVSLERVRETGRPDTLPVQKYPIADADGVLIERHWLAVHVPVLDADGRVVLLVQRTEDITEFAVERDRVAALAAEHDDGGWRAQAERVEADLFLRARELADAVAAKDIVARQVASLAEVALALTSAATLADVEHIVVGRGLPVLGSEGGGIVSPHGSGGWRITVSDSIPTQRRVSEPTEPYDSAIPGCWSARTGQRLLLPTRASGLAFAHDIMTEVYATTQRLGWAFLPLIVGERRIGSLAASWVDEHPFADAELDLLDGFAAQCAQAMLRIEIADAQRADALEMQQLAESLQQALLTPPPEPDHLRIVVRYRPAGHNAQVGGDWYDAFLQPSGATMLVIGDVVGHDSTAAAKMGQLRGVLRTLAYDADGSVHADTPAAILTRLEHAARGLAINTLATTVLARIEQPGGPGTGRTMRWSNAGHLPPVLVHADGSVELLETEPDLLLGVEPNTERHDHCVELPDGSTLLLYTDGLVERRDASLEVGEDALRAALHDLGEADVDDLLDALLARVAPDSGEDDIALLAMRANPEDRPRPLAAGPSSVPKSVPEAGSTSQAESAALPEPAGGPAWTPPAVLELPSDADAPAVARRFVTEHAADLPAPVREDAELLVSELVTNAVRYGQPSITLQVRLDIPGIAVLVTDTGDVFPTLPADPGPAATSGRGLIIVDAVADRWGVRPGPDRVGKTVWFELRSDGTGEHR